jgi:hypothetical protein
MGRDPRRAGFILCRARDMHKNRPLRQGRATFLLGGKHSDRRIFRAAPIRSNSCAPLVFALLDVMELAAPLTRTRLWTSRQTGCAVGGRRPSRGVDPRRQGSSRARR